MKGPAIELGEARARLELTPPAGAKARVFRAVMTHHRPSARRRPVYALVLAALTLATTSAAIGLPQLARWVGWHPALGPVRERAPSRAQPAERAKPQPHRASAPSAAPTFAPAPAEPTPANPSATPAVLAPAGDASRSLVERGSAQAVPPPGASSPGASSPGALSPGASSLAEEVALYREAVALVTTSPGLAVVRLRAHRERFPESALREEVSVRLVQAFTALGRDADARREARSFSIRYPHSAKRAEMQAIADGAPLRSPVE